MRSTERGRGRVREKERGYLRAIATTIRIRDERIERAESGRRGRASEKESEK